MIHTNFYFSQSANPKSGLNQQKFLISTHAVPYINPFIYITPRKPLMSSGSQLTLRYYDVYYLTAFNYHQGQYLSALRRLTANFLTHLFYQDHYLPSDLAPQYQQRSLLTQEDEGRGLSAHFSTHLFYQGHYLPCKIYCLVLACIKAIIYIRLLSFCHDRANI